MYMYVRDRCTHVSTADMLVYIHVHAHTCMYSDVHVSVHMSVQREYMYSDYIAYRCVVTVHVGAAHSACTAYRCAGTVGRGV